MRRHIHDLHVVCHDEFLQPLRDERRESRLEVQQQFVLKREDVQVALNLSLGGGEGGVTTFSDAEFLHVVGDLPMQKPHAIRARQANAATKTQIENPGGFKQRGVFASHVAVIRHDFRIVHGGEVRAETLVKFAEKQWRWFAHNVS